jgi:predicted CoA-binding protein
MDTCFLSHPILAGKEILEEKFYIYLTVIEKQINKSIFRHSEYLLAEVVKIRNKMKQNL